VLRALYRVRMVIDAFFLFDRFQVRQQLYDAGFQCEMDIEGDTLNKKVRNAQLAQFNFILG
jgi:threonyl-tRNA synthetase